MKKSRLADGHKSRPFFWEGRTNSFLSPPPPPFDLFLNSFIPPRSVYICYYAVEPLVLILFPSQCPLWLKLQWIWSRDKRTYIQSDWDSSRHTDRKIHTQTDIYTSSMCSYLYLYPNLSYSSSSYVTPFPPPPHPSISFRDGTYLFKKFLEFFKPISREDRNVFVVQRISLSSLVVLLMILAKWEEEHEYILTNKPSRTGENILGPFCMPSNFSYPWVF